jgi:dTDP-4-amino-4,6-dideoxygalactose transaminase
MPSGQWEYEVSGVGFKANLSDMAAAVGNAQLPKLGRFHERRRRIADIYDERFAGADVVRLPVLKTDSGASSCHLYVIRQSRRPREDVIAGMTAHGIGTSVHFKPLHLHKFYQRELGSSPGTCPVATAEFATVTSLPIYSRMEDADAHRVANALLDILSEG